MGLFDKLKSLISKKEKIKEEVKKEYNVEEVSEISEDMLEEIEDNFYVIEETTHRRVFEGTREQCFKYYKTHADIFKNQFKRIAVLKEL